MRKYFLILLFLFCVPGYICLCQNLTVLPLADAYKKQESIYTKEFIESFTYIPLETSPECLIGGNPYVKLTNEFIIVTEQTRCFLFDKATGKFVREIGRTGRGPGEYQSTRGFFRDSNSTFYFTGTGASLIK